mgnify:CR=1 FL=1
MCAHKPGTWLLDHPSANEARGFACYPLKRVWKRNVAYTCLLGRSFWFVWICLALVFRLCKPYCSRGQHVSTEVSFLR